MEEAQAEANAAIAKAEKEAAATLEEARAKAAEIIKEQEQIRDAAETARQQVSLLQSALMLTVVVSWLSSLLPDHRTRTLVECSISFILLWSSSTSLGSTVPA